VEEKRNLKKEIRKQHTENIKKMDNHANNKQKPKEKNHKKGGIKTKQRYT